MIDTYDFENALESKTPLTQLIDLRTKKYLLDINYPGLYIFWFNNHDGAIKNLKRNLIIKGPSGLENNVC